MLYHVVSCCIYFGTIITAQLETEDSWGNDVDSGRQVNINEVSDKVRNQALRYQQGDEYGQPIQATCTGMCRHTCRCKTNNFQAHDFLFDSVAFLLTEKEQTTFVSRHLRGSFLAVEKTFSMPAFFSSFFVVGRLNGNGYKTDRCLYLTKWTRPSGANKIERKKGICLRGKCRLKGPSSVCPLLQHHLFSPENNFPRPRPFFFRFGVPSWAMHS